LIVPGLQGTEIFVKAEEVVKEQVGEVNGDNHNGISLPNGNGIEDAIHQEPAIPKFTCLYVDPPLRADLYEDPDEEVQDKVLFVLNNVSERNLREKINDLTEAVEERHHQWFANYLVEERAKMQPNFQQLYLDMLDLTTRLFGQRCFVRHTPVLSACSIPTPHWAPQSAVTSRTWALGLAL
jgi:CCR4-NOT transcription complex subunit 1